MKKKFRIIASILLIAVLVVGIFTFSACSDKEDGNNETSEPTKDVAKAPGDVKISGEGLITWSIVSGAASYDVSVNGEEISVIFTRYDLYKVTNKPKDGKFTIKVRTVMKDGRKSDWSKELSYTMDGGQLLHPIITGVSNGIITWYANNDSTETVITINGTESVVSKDVTSYDISNVEGDEIEFSVLFKGDGVYYKDSKANTVIYYSKTGEVRLPEPQNVRMIGQTLVFDEVIGADIYYLRDYNNTVISVTTNEIDMSSGYLTKTVKAGITSGAYLDSKEADVAYFYGNAGKGTEEEPYIVTTADEFRYIEFYESVGESKYYELGSDVYFDDLELKPDEFGSNAYKLGSFSGVLDGKNYALKNIKVYHRDGYSSLFGSVTKNAVIKNLVIDNSDWRTWTVRSNDGVTHEKGGEVAILCYTNRGLITNVTVKNSSIVALQDGAAGLVSINRGEISGCVIERDTKIYGNLEAGGIAIYNDGTISNCINRGTVEGNMSIGGIVGRNAGMVSACSNEGNVNGIKKVGGIVGYNYNVVLNGTYEKETLVRYCSNIGVVTGSTVVGGLVGQNGTDGTEEIGFLSVAGASVAYSYNAGEVKGSSVLGGLVGSNFSNKGLERGVVGCYNIGKVATDNEVTASFTRIFLDAGDCDWVANDNARMYCHYWGSQSSTWPGVPMSSFTLDDRLYYYVDINVENLKGIIFNRCDYSGKIYNSTPNLDVLKSTTVYKLPSDFTSKGGWVLSNGIAERMPTVIGALCGYNAEINDCYYVEGSAKKGANPNGGIQTNVIKVDGEKTTNVEITAEYVNSKEFVDKLNDLSENKCWKVGTEHAVFAWQ